MEPVKYRRLNPGVELFTIFILTFFFLTSELSKGELFVLIGIMTFMYLLLTGISWYSNGPAVLLKPVKEPELYGERVSLSDDEKIYHINRSILFNGLFKLTILLLPVLIILIRGISGLYLFTVISLVIFFNIAAALIIMTISVRYLLNAHGYKSLNFRDVLSKGVFYYNPRNKNSVVDKPFGIGQTINIANKEGRIILYILLGFPLLMMIIIIVLVNAAGNL